MEKDSLIHLIAYASSIISLKLEENSNEFEENMKFLSKKRNSIYSTSPEEIELNSEVESVQSIIKKYQNLPNLPQFQ